MSTSARKTHPTLLICSAESGAMLVSQGAIFNSAGYPVILAPSRENIEHHLAHTVFDIAVLNHTLPFSERKKLARRIKKMDPDLGILILHASGALDNPYADIAVDSRLGPQATLLAVKRVDLMRTMRKTHSNLRNEYLVIVDHERNYVFASDAACELLGYDRPQFLELRIDDVVAGSTPVTEPLFKRFVAENRQQGVITLRHRSGRLLDVKYLAEVHESGYMLARWQPISSAPVDKSRARELRHQK